MAETLRNHDPDIFRNNASNGRYIPQNLEFLSIQKTSIPVDFEAQIREIDTALEGTVLKEPQSVEEFSDSLAIHSNVVVSKSNGPVVTLSSGLAQYGSLSEADKATPTFVLGPGDVISKTLNSRKRNV